MGIVLPLAISQPRSKRWYEVEELAWSRRENAYLQYSEDENITEYLHNKRKAKTRIEIWKRQLKESKKPERFRKKNGDYFPMTIVIYNAIKEKREGDLVDIIGPTPSKSSRHSKYLKALVEDGLIEAGQKKSESHFFQAGRDIVKCFLKWHVKLLKEVEIETYKHKKTEEK